MMIADIYYDEDDERPFPEVRYWIRRVLLGKSLKEQRKGRHPIIRKFQRVLRLFASEFIGTFFLVLFICGIQLADVYSRDVLGDDDINLISKGIVGGFVLAGLIYAFGGLSGAHLNPVVTLAFFLRGIFDLRLIPVYWLAQFSGAIAASGVLLGVFGNIGNLAATIPSEGTGIALSIEIIITFILLTAILLTSERAEILGPQSALAVASVFTALLLFAWNISGASANPFRSLAPTIIGGAGWSTIWVYIVGPFVGMFLAVLVQRFLISRRSLKSKKILRKEKQETDTSVTNNGTGPEMKRRRDANEMQDIESIV